MAVAQVARHLAARAGADLGEGGVDPGLGGVGLGRERQVDSRLGQVDAALGHADDLGGAEGRVGHEQCRGVGVADVLGGADHDAAGDELGVLAGVEHAREPVEHGVGVAAAHRLDEGRDDVVVHVAGLVVGQAAAGVGLAHVLGEDPERGGRGTVGPLAVRRRVDHLARQLERGERRPSVPARERHDLVGRLGRELVGAGQALRRGHGAGEQLADRVVVQGLQLHHAASADERRVDLEVGVLGGGADEHHRAVLHGVQQGVLLAAVEAVDLVHKEDRPPAEGEQAGLGGLDLPAEVLDRAGDGADLHELGVRGVRDDARERGLAGAGRAVEDDRRERVVLDGAPEPAAGAHGLRLPDEAVERVGPHAGRERRVLVSARGLYVGEERVHGGDCTSSPGHGALLAGRTSALLAPQPPIFIECTKLLI